MSDDDLDFGQNTKRVELALEATSRADALVSLLMRADDSNHLKDCMAIIGPKLIELFAAQFSALSDQLATIDAIKAQIGIKEVANV